MLYELHLENYAIAKNISVVFGEGLNVVTGETGAGKSLLIDALLLVLGGRVCGDVVREGADSALIEARFEAPAAGGHTLESAPFEASPASTEYLLRRVLSCSGKSRAYINGRMSSLSELQKLSEKFISIRGQGDEGVFADPVQQGRLFDTWGGLCADVAAYAQGYAWLCTLKHEQAHLTQSLSERKQKEDFLRFQQIELQNAHLTENEETTLDVEMRLLKNQEAIHAILQKAYTHLTDEDGILSRMGIVGKAVLELQSYVGPADTEISFWQRAEIELKELTDILRLRLSQRPADPHRLDVLTERFYCIGQLKKKYGHSVEAMLARLEKITAELSELSGGALDLQDLEVRVSSQGAACREAAQALSHRRHEIKDTLAEVVNRHLHQLGMEKTTFDISICEQPLRENGQDHVAFLMALSGEKAQGIEQVASGGERSRVMLALSVALVEADPVPTLVFDEMDRGVGGGIAERVGICLRQLSRHHQVLCITHLPQIAALAAHHYVVEKQTEGDRVVATVRRLSDAERVTEIARMLGGITPTSLARRHAQEMLRARPVG